MSTAVQRWEPNSPPQTRFLSFPGYEALYGGAAGGGKTDSLLMGALRYVGQPGYRALLLRRTFPELQRSLMERADIWYRSIGGHRTESGRIWKFGPSTIEFGHVEHEDDVLKYYSAEFQYIAFDELTTFTENQYTKLLSRLRSSNGIPVRARAGTNPGGDGHEWVLNYWGPWLRAKDPDYKGIKAAPGETLWYTNTPDGMVWIGRSLAEAQARAAAMTTQMHAGGTLPLAEVLVPLSRVFVPALASDNPALMEGDPAYIARLGGLAAIDRKRLKDGDWLAKPGRGSFFKRAWFDIVEAAPVEVVARWRHWDLAATVEGFDTKGKPTDPDWTAGLKLSLTANGIWFVEHVHRFRGRPAEVEDTIKSYAITDGVDWGISIPQDPGQAGVAQVAAYVKMLAGWNVRARKETGDKITRAKPVSAQAEAHNIKIVRGDWNAAFFDEAEAFPEGKKDQIDALSGAFTATMEEDHDVDLGDDPVAFGTSGR